MINFRYHLVSLAALFLALAAGIGLGAGPLKGTVDARVASRDAVVAPPAATADQTAIARFERDYAAVVGPGLLSKRLSGSTVAVFTMPGADHSTVKAVETDLTAAGARVTTEVALLPKLLDPSGRQFVQGVSQQSLSGVSGVTAGTEANYQLAGTALARAFLARGTASPAFDSGSATVASAFKAAGLISTGATPTQRAGLALVIAGGSSRVLDGQDEIVATLTAALDAGARGTLLAGPPQSARGNGLVKAVRDRDAARTVSTFDVLDEPVGRIVAVLVLQHEASGTTGHYGAVGAKNGALPPLGR